MRSIHAKRHQALGRIIRDARLRADISLRDMTSMTGIPGPRLSDLERGSGRFDPFDLVLIFRALKLTQAVVERLADDDLDRESDRARTGGRSKKKRPGRIRP
jgi:transcriptional regulator with XRE-family HTH domain